MAKFYANLLIQQALNQIHNIDAGPEDGIWGSKSQAALDKFADSFNQRAKTKVETIQSGGLSLSKLSVEKIIDFETGGQNYYEKHLSKPVYAGYASGVTIGVGYDCGYKSKYQITEDWKSFLPERELFLLSQSAGKTRKAAENYIKECLQDIRISWRAAIKVFENSTLPKFSSLTKKTFKGIENYHPHVQGMLVSLVFNRGSKLEGSTRIEMKNIANMVANKEPTIQIAKEFRKMKRLWVGKGVDGLLKRRDEEADLIASV